MHIKTLDWALNHGLVFRKGHQVIKFNLDVWLKAYMTMNLKLRKKEKTDFEKYFFKLINNLVFGKALENVRKHRDIKIVMKEARGN